MASLRAADCWLIQTTFSACAALSSTRSSAGARRPCAKVSSRKASRPRMPLLQSTANSLAAAILTRTCPAPRARGLCRRVFVLAVACIQRLRRFSRRRLPSFDVARKHALAAGFRYATPLHRGDLASCVNFEYRFVTKIPAELGLPALPAELNEPNWAEGIVVRPAIEPRVRAGDAPWTAYQGWRPTACQDQDPRILREAVWLPEAMEGCKAGR